MGRQIKKIISLVIVTVVFFTGCTSKTNSVKKPEENKTGQSTNTETKNNKTSSSNMINITERLYVSWINEIYTNGDKYLGKTIHIEGMFKAEAMPPSNKTYYFIYRIGPGCCGNDGNMCGFEFTYEGDMPKGNDWIEVTGVLNEYKEDDGTVYLTLKASKVNVLDKRGSEKVYN